MTASPGSHEPEQEPPTAEETNTAQATRAIQEETTDEATLTTEQRGVLRNNENSDTNSSASGNTNGGTIRVHRTANITSIEDDPLEYLGRDHRNYHMIKFPGHGRPQECSDTPCIVSLAVAGKPLLLIQQQEDLTVHVNPFFRDAMSAKPQRMGLA